MEMLTDNDPACCSGAFTRFAERWAMRVRFRCANVASRSGISERCHRSVKRIAARTRCTIEEAVYWYNVAPKDDVDSATAPANKPTITRFGNLELTAYCTVSQAQTTVRMTLETACG